MFLLLAACRLGGPADDDDPGETAEPCPQLDCRDALTVHVREPYTGTPVAELFAYLTAEGLDLRIGCPSEEEVDGGYCTGEGFVVWGTYSPIELTIATVPDGPSWGGTLTPAYADPYATEECGPYCMTAEETITLVPCEGCG